MYRRVKMIFDHKEGNHVNLLAILLCVLALLIVSEDGWADERVKVQELPPLEVTGKRVKGLLRNELTTNTINPEAKIEAGETNDITDLLKESQSILVQDSSYGKKVFLRGLEDQNMRILINGMPVGQMGKYYARSFEWETIPVDAIERIDVTKGVGSAEYGNTLAGTINIITKRGTKRLKTRLRGSYGRFYDGKATLTNSGSYGPLHWFIGGSYHTRDEYLKNNDL
ncbi:MAG TPA: hypothetical protein ENI41_01145 [Deltaproteobacteria bacterium]|nr:hypothetical protein [Deltaproteobacteria bacterium]